MCPCVNAIFKPEKGKGGIPSSTGFLKRSSAMRQIDFLPLFCFWVRKDSHAHILWPWEPFLLVYIEKTLAFNRCNPHAQTQDTPWEHIFLWWKEKKDTDKILIACPIICVRISELLKMRSEEEEVAFKKQGGVMSWKRKGRVEGGEEREADGG